MAELSRTGDVCYDPGGNLYIADINNNRVRKVTFSNSPPHFTGGHSQSLVLCENTTDSISSLLAVNDSDVGQTETWSLMSAPLHGTATVAYATTTTGTTMTPTGLTYAPATGFSGSDSFKVIVNDCAGAFDTTVIHVTVNPLPSVITGTRTVCLAYTITLSDTLTGGAWNSGTTSVAIIGSSTGIVTGVTAGLAIITYTLPTGCIACTTVTVIATPGPVTGIAVTCIGSTTTLYDAGGGTWSSSAPGIATIGTTTGIVTGISTGTATMTYLLIPGCTATFTVTVSPVPTPIAGITGICIGGVTAFTDGVAGGYWSSGSTGIATIGSGSGILTGISGGTTLITYAIAPGTLCSAVTMVTVNPMPGIITGTTVVCTGQVTTLSDAGGGTWSSSSSGIATVGSASGVVTGISAGTATITYTLPSGCSTTTTLSVIPSPVPISGSTHVCLGATTTLTDTATGGYWSSSDYTTANIDAGTGVVTGLLTGTVTITYTISSGCFTTLAVTVNPAPSPIVGTLSMCPGATSILTESGGGLWGSSTPSVASIGSASGIVISATTGTTTITYTLPSGCFATAVVTVNPLPSVITGPGTVCIGTTIPLADGTTGGTWSKSNTNVNVGMVTGVVTGVTAGTTAITYTLPTGCYATRTVTVNSSPGIVTGILSVCIGATTTLSDPATGGLWTSTTPTVATIGSASGVVTGMAAGTSVMTYSIGSGCIAMATVTVNALPAVIGGPTSVCAGGATITLTDGTTGGTWSAAGSSVTVGATTGVVTGLTAGTAIIAYTGASGCFRTTTITVNPLPGTITGPLALCVGATIPLTDASPGGTWTSSTTAVATIGSGTGMLTGVTTGITAITYTLPTGCKTTATETVSTTPGPITGTATVCIGSTVTLGDIIPGGTWSSSSTNAAIGSLTGIVTGISAGTTIITYSLGSGCTVTRIMTVTPAPGAISGASAMCAGATTTLIDGTTGGVWTSGSTGTATIGATSGIVSAIVAGTTTITYTIGATGCSATMSITVNPTPSAITGPATVCTGSAITESDGVAGGTWSTTGTLLTIGGSTGVVTGVTSGMAIITYSIGSCTTTRTISVNAASPITGAPGMCAGTTSTLADATPGGTWTSSTPATATIGSATGLVTAMTPGTTTITYTIPSGCNVIMTITVNLGPSAIGGTLHVCPGATTALTDAAGGGIWISGSTTIAIIGSSTGVATGVTAGTTTITYSLGTGCTVTALLTVNPLPGAITGPSSVCPATTTTLSDGTTGGTWSSGSPGVATIGSLSGMVAGVTAGTSVITYTLPTGCISTRAETVNTGPAAITGTASVCVDLTSLLSDATGGGTWTSSATSIATISTAGLVTGILAGTTTISYTLSTGCAATIVVTVNPAPAPIGGAGIVCAGATTALTDAVTGGAWSSSIPSIATIGSATGIVTGITAGTVLITYSAGAGCSVTKTVTVTALPSPITGPTTVVCVGTAITLTDATPGGIWTSSNALIASIGSGTGVVTGINTGTAVITYSIGSGCIITRGITVNPAPPSITGANHICVGGTTSLAIATTGGAWSSGSLGIATVGSMTGVVTGTGGGLVTISYTLTPGCVVTYAVTVTAVPSFTGLTTRCAWGDTLTVHDSDPTGSYSSTVATVLNLGSGYGRVTTFAPGISTVTYTLLSGCSVTESFTVNPLPGLITGSMNVCIGTTATLYNTTSGGVWTSNNPAIASAGSATGIVTGISLGTTYVTYTLPTGCKVDTPVHVNSSPAMIVGYPTMVVGTTGTYTDGTTGGIWSSSNSAIATISVSTGVVHAVSVGVVTLTYTAITGCYSTKTVSVNPATGVSLEGVDETIIADGIIVVPNPNKGAFTITGKLGNVTGEEEVCIEMTDMLGRVVYKNMVLSNDGIIGLQVMLSDKLVNGMYLLSFHSGTENRMTHVVVNR